MIILILAIYIFNNYAKIKEGMYSSSLSGSGWSGSARDRCGGDCDYDTDKHNGCKGFLKCKQRNGYERVPGCSGNGRSGFDYCYNPYINYDNETVGNTMKRINNFWTTRNANRTWPGHAADYYTETKTMPSDLGDQARLHYWFHVRDQGWGNHTYLYMYLHNETKGITYHMKSGYGRNGKVHSGTINISPYVAAGDKVKIRFRPSRWWSGHRLYFYRFTNMHLDYNVKGNRQGPKGDRGPAGPRGYKGSGSRGPRGHAGKTIKGQTGAKGARGSQGIAGPSGAKGATGPRGIQGPAGKDGDGIRGQKGETGPRGQRGERGPQGIAGTGLVPKTFGLAQQYDKGDYVFSDSNRGVGKSMFIAQGSFTAQALPKDDDTNWVEFRAEKGDKGDKGNIGDTGQTGRQGPKGNTGEKGEMGYPGLTGPTGSTGLQGPQGDIGIRGPRGWTGIQGNTGIRGERGSRGDKGDTGYIKQFKVVKKGVPDMTISDFDCKKHAQTLGSTYYRSDNKYYASGCQEITRPSGTKEYTFNNSVNTTNCGKVPDNRNFKGYTIACLQELPYNLVKTYNTEFDLVSAGPSDKSVPKLDCKRYGDMNGLDMTVIDDKNAPPGCFRWRKNKKGTHTKRINNIPVTISTDYKDEVYYNDTLGMGVNCGIDNKVCVQQNPHYKDNNKTIFNQIKLNTRLQEQQKMLAKYKSQLKNLNSQIVKANKNNQMYQVAAQQQAGAVLPGGTTTQSGKFVKINNPNLKFNTIGALGQAIAAGTVTQKDLRPLSSRGQLIKDVAAAETQLGTFKAPKKKKKKKQKSISLWNVEGLKNEYLYDRPSLFRWVTDLFQGKKEGMDNNNKLNKKFITDLVDLIIKKMNAEPMKDLHQIQISKEELMTLKTTTQPMLPDNSMKTLLQKQDKIGLMSLMVMTDTNSPIVPEDVKKIIPANAMDIAINHGKSILEDEIIKHFNNKNQMEEKDLHLIARNKFNNQMVTNSIKGFYKHMMKDTPRDKQWFENLSIPNPVPGKPPIKLNLNKPVSSSPLPSDNDLGKGAGSKMNMDTPLTGNNSGPAMSPQAADEMQKNKCIKGCVKPESIHADCSKDIIRQVIDGQDKYFRMCSKVCLPRNHTDYVNYDKSGPDLPYNPIDHGCRDTQAHCVKNCSKSMVEVDENGRDLNQLNRKTVPLYSKSKMFSVSQTNNMFGQTDNRLGGSKTAYKKDYKPEDPHPKDGFGYSDAMWSFKP